MNSVTHNPKNCQALFAKLSEYLDNELDPATARHIKAHLDQCKPCQVCLATLKRTVQLCGAAKNVPVPDRLAQRLRKLICPDQ
jgi:anti-sigma factor RsiW